MSDSPNLPFPKLRDVLNAQSGMLFFLKWMICAATGGVFKAACLFGMLNSGIQFGTVENLVFYTVPIALQMWALFGHGWRLWGWIAATFGVAMLLTMFGRGGYWMIWLTAAFANAVVQTPLLIAVRRRPALWLLAVPLASLFEFLVLGKTPIQGTVRSWISSLPLGPMGSFWAFAQLRTGVELMMAMILGATLAWLMPPVSWSRGSSAETNRKAVPGGCGHE